MAFHTVGARSIGPLRTYRCQSSTFSMKQVTRLATDQTAHYLETGPGLDQTVIDFDSVEGLFANAGERSAMALAAGFEAARN